MKRRVAHIKQYYQRTDDKNLAENRSYHYLSEATMNHFVDESSQHIFRIYQQLWINGVSGDGFISALEMNI